MSTNPPPSPFEKKVEILSLPSLKRGGEGFQESYPMIDFFTHVVPPKYKLALSQLMPELDKRISGMPTLYDMDRRFRIMDNYPNLTQVLTLSLTAALVLENPGLAVDFAKRANDEMAELVAKYP